MNWLNSILVFLAAFVAVYLEAAWNGPRYVLGAQLDLLPPLMVYAGLTCSLSLTTALAVAAGLWFDSLSNNTFGVTMLPLAIVGVAVNHRRGLILQEQYFARFVLGFCASLAVPIMTLLLLLSTRQSPILGWGSAWQWLIMGLGGAVLTPLLFRLFEGLNAALSYRPSIETSFRPDREIRRGRN